MVGGLKRRGLIAGLPLRDRRDELVAELRKVDAADVVDNSEMFERSPREGLDCWDMRRARVVELAAEGRKTMARGRPGGGGPW